MGAHGIIVVRSLPPALITQRAVPAAAASEAEDAREEKCVLGSDPCVEGICVHSEDRVCVDFLVSVVQGRVPGVSIPESPIIPCRGEKVVSLDVEFDRCVLEGKRGSMEWE